MSDTDTRPTPKPRRITGLPKIEVIVDQTTLENSKRRNSQHCWIAESIKIACPGVRSAEVDLQTIRFSDAEKRLRYIYLTPRVCQEAIIEYDSGELPQPFTFKLNKPVQITRIKPASKPLTEEQRTHKLELQKEREAKNRERRKEREKRYATEEKIRAVDLDTPFDPPQDYTNEIIEALNDPTADLGPPVAIRASSYGDQAVPIIVGGKSPRYPTNIQRRRLFGLKALKK
jgi:hypothetical protein